MHQWESNLQFAFKDQTPVEIVTVFLNEMLTFGSSHQRKVSKMMAKDPIEYNEEMDEEFVPVHESDSESELEDADEIEQEELEYLKNTRPVRRETPRIDFEDSSDDEEFVAESEDDDDFDEDIDQEEVKANIVNAKIDQMEPVRRLRDGKEIVIPELSDVAQAMQRVLEI